MKILGIALIILGFVSLVYGGFSYRRDKTVVDLGGLQVHADQKQTLPISPIVGGVALLAGLLLVVTDRRRA
ncbi:MAG: DUF3185 domain-containing protein [Candidatus Eisenbacteria bacterium]